MTEKLFLVPHVTDIVVEKLDDESQLPNDEQFKAQFPALFALSGGLNHLDYSVMKSLNEAGREYYALGQMINAQNDKINMIIGFLLSEHESDKNRYYTKAISGQSIDFYAPLLQDFKEGDYLRVKLYLIDFALAIYAYARVSKVTSSDIEESTVLYKSDNVICEYFQKENDENSQNFDLTKQDRAENLNVNIISVDFVRIREQDVDSLVTATFNIQSRQLRHRALAKSEK